MNAGSLALSFSKAEDWNVSRHGARISDGFPSSTLSKKKNTRILGNDKESLDGSWWCLYMFGFEFTLTEWFRNIFPENKHWKKAMMTHIGLIKVNGNCFGKMEPYRNSHKIPTGWNVRGMNSTKNYKNTERGNWFWVDSSKDQTNKQTAAQLILHNFKQKNDHL